MKHFCPLPFSHMEVDPVGDMKPCCMYKGKALDNQGKPGSALTHGFSDVFNGEWYKELRRKMLADEPDDGCRSCYAEEANGIQSRRLRELALNYPKFQTDEGLLISLDIKLGNVCNLTCIICNPFSSSRVLEEEIKLGIGYGTNGRKAPKSLYERFKWYNNDEFWAQLENHLGSLGRIDIMGGEPMLAKKHFVFLQRLIDAGHAGHIGINYVTNGTIYSPEVIQNLYKNFESVYITLSADAIGSTYEYARHPARWEQFLGNLRRYKSHGHAMTISYSVSAYSLFGIFDALDFYLAEGGVTVWFNIVYNEDRNIQLLPQALKEKFMEQLKLRYKPEWESIFMKSDLNSLINYMNQEHTYESSWPAFCKRTAILDNNRGNNLLEAVPEFQGYYENKL